MAAPAALPRRAGDGAGEAAARHFAALRAAFARAAAAQGERLHDLAVGGAGVRLRFAGPALERAVLPALAHLARPAPGGAPALEALVFDSASTGVGVPERPWSPEDVVARGEVDGFSGARVRTIDHEYDGLTVYDAATRTVVYWAADARRVPWYERAAPLRTPLHWALSAPRRHLVHAAAVGRGERGILLAGPSGSGKSTVALACLEAGLAYAGDDYVLLCTERTPTAFSIYGTAKMTPATAALLPGLSAAAAAGARDGEKLVLDVRERGAAGLVGSLPVYAIVLPRVTGTPRPLLRPAAPFEALRALAPSTLLQLPHNGPAALTALAALVRAVPSHVLELGSDVAPVPGLLARLLEQEAAR